MDYGSGMSHGMEAEMYTKTDLEVANEQKSGVRGARLAECGGEVVTTPDLVFRACLLSAVTDRPFTASPDPTGTLGPDGMYCYNTTSFSTRYITLKLQTRHRNLELR